MKRLLAIVLSTLLFALFCTACVSSRDQTNGSVNSVYPATSNANDVNYQEMMREQSQRAQLEAADAEARGHGGGGRR